MRRRLQRGFLRPNRNSRSATISWILAAVLAVSGGCGYHVVGRTNTLPSGAHTIAVPAFVNRTTTYRVEQILTQAVVREFIARTSYRVRRRPEAGACRATRRRAGNLQEPWRKAERCPCWRAGKL